LYHVCFSNFVKQYNTVLLFHDFHKLIGHLRNVYRKFSFQGMNGKNPLVGGGE